MKTKAARSEIITILALNVCSVVDACDECYALAERQYASLLEHPDEVRTMRKALKKLEATTSAHC